MDCMRDAFDQDKLLGNRFVTISPLNHGSFGMVFAAKDTLTGDDVAIKCITKPGAADSLANCPASMAIDDRSEELDLHSRLGSHPNIVNLVHHFETKHHQYMVLELCSNGDLYEAIRTGRGPLETEHVREFMLQLVDSIDHIHSHGVYHRDIKPENIFLTSDGTMKLGDFGLATTDTWSTEFAVGSDRYMAPEQFASSVYGYGYSPASADVWAIGIVLLNVLFQRNPFATPTQKDPLFADFVHDRQSIFDVFPNMSNDTYNVLVHSLALDPANRSLGAVREALKAVVSFTTDDDVLDDFCAAEQIELVPVATAAREPLRTPSVSTATVGGDSFPWATALLKTPQKTSRQLSTIPDESSELFPGSVKSEYRYTDTDESSLSSALDSGLGMSYKSTKSTASRPLVSFVGSLPISFSRPSHKASPYGTSSSGFSKSWSDLWDEDEEVDENDESRSSMDAGMEIELVNTAKAVTPQLNAIREEDRGSVTPRQAFAELDVNSRTASPLRKLIEEDKKNDSAMSPKQRSSSILDKWSALGNFRRKTEVTVAAAPASPLAFTPASAPAPVPFVATPVSQKTKYAEAFANFTPFSSTKKLKAQAPPPPQTQTRDRATSWRQGSPARLRSTSTNNSRVWERKDKDIVAAPQSHPQESWAVNSNWREHKSPIALKAVTPRSLKNQKSWMDFDFDDKILDELDDNEWVGGYNLQL